MPAVGEQSYRRRGHNLVSMNPRIHHNAEKMGINGQNSRARASRRPFRAQAGGGTTQGSAPPPSTLGYIPSAASRLKMLVTWWDRELPHLGRGPVAVRCVLAVILVAILGACGGVKRSTPVEVFADMDHQQNYQPQEASTFFPDGRASRPPVELSNTR